MNAGPEATNIVLVHGGFVDGSGGVVHARRPGPGDRGLVGSRRCGHRRRTADRRLPGSAASWRWIFFINVPIAAVVVALGARHLPESRDPDATGRLDYAGALTAAVFLSGITFAFIEAPSLGWTSPAVLTMASLGVAGLGPHHVAHRHHRNQLARTRAS